MLSGLHNNLRRQTQVRFPRTSGADAWHNWTTPDADFGGATGGAAILTGDVPSLAVVKKNQTRLESLRDWLRAIPPEIRERTPILLLDDEADQATPSTAAQRAQKRGINKLVREIWDEIKTGTYVGYTATPFANVFMDPTDERELYPADFIIDLPRPDAYYGAERVFGREPLDDADEPDPGLPMVRKIKDADGLRPPSKRATGRLRPRPPGVTGGGHHVVHRRHGHTRTLAARPRNTARCSSTPPTTSSRTS